VVALGLVVVLGDLRPQLDLAHVHLLLVTADLHQVEVALLRVLERLVGLDHPHLAAVVGDQPHLRHADALVDPRLVALRRAPIELPRDRH
jgi:hypothetical protein